MVSSEEFYHRPVLLQESVDLLSPQSGGLYVDVTFGGGGHSREILSRFEGGKLFGFDRDADAVKNEIEGDRFELIRSDFKYIKRSLEDREIDEVDGIIADLGISSHQIDVPDRGFSFRFDSRLDMRMDQREGLSAIEVLNGYSRADLRRVFRIYGEIKNFSRLTESLMLARERRRIETTGQLEEAIADCVPAKIRKKYLSQVYQAIRIEVNGELESLEALLLGSLDLLKPGGRLVVISYHSLEDRMVKNFFRYGNLERRDERDIFGRSLSPLKIITRKALIPSDEEIEINPRARSAKLRAVEKIETDA